MEETVIEIPEAAPEEGWQPPVLTQQKSEKPPKIQSCADVFFIQYVVCILLLTAVFAIRYYDRALCDSMLTGFQEQTHAPTEVFVTELIAFLQSQWS